MKECWSEGALRAYLDRELPPEDMERVAAHLEVCSECGDQWAELAGRAERVSSLMGCLTAPEPVVAIRKAPRRPVSRMVWAGAAAALAAGLLLGFVMKPKSQAPIIAGRPPLPAPVVLAPPDPVELPQRATTAVARPARAPRGQTVRRRALPVDRASDDFVSLDDEPISTGVVLRVELGPNGVPADVIFGPDGRPHAIRLVNQSK